VEPSSALAQERNCPMSGPADSVPLEPMGSRARRAAFFVLGTVMLVLGVIGILVPVLPTTCFLLGAAACYGRSSTRFYNWMYTNRLFGDYLRNYRDHRAMPARVKYGSITLLWVTIGISIALVDILWVRILLLGIAVAVSIHVASLKILSPGSTGS